MFTILVRKRVKQRLQRLVLVDAFFVCGGGLKYLAGHGLTLFTVYDVIRKWPGRQIKGVELHDFVGFCGENPFSLKQLRQDTPAEIKAVNEKPQVAGLKPNAKRTRKEKPMEKTEPIEKEQVGGLNPKCEMRTQGEAYREDGAHREGAGWGP